MPNFAQAGEAGRALIAAHLIEGGPGDPDTLELAATLCNFAPAMVEALRMAADALEGDIFTDAEECGASVENARAVHRKLREILARIDGTPTAQLAAPTASAAEPTAICCTSCGSTSVCKDAAARWDGSDWELSSTYDDSTCDACGYEGSGFEEVPLSELRAWREDQGFDADALEKDEEL